MLRLQPGEEASTGLGRRLWSAQDSQPEGLEFRTFQVYPPWTYRPRRWQAETAVIPEGGTSHVQHGTARVHHAARRRGGGVADRGAGAAAGDAGDRPIAERITGLLRARVARLSTGLAEGGYVEGHNVALEYRWAEDRNERFPQLAAELVQRGVSVLAAVGSPAVAAAKATTTTTPIVFYVGVDPVSFGFVSSLSRPGGNLTGVTNFSLEVGPKRLELLADLLGPQKVVGILLNPRRAPRRK